MRRILKVGAVAALAALGLAKSAVAQNPPPSPSPAPSPAASPAAEEARTTGLPHGVNWKFNLDASWANFGFANSFYNNPKPEEPSGDLSDNWFEGSVKPGITGTYTFKSSSELYGQLSAVGERTYGAGPSVVGEDASSFKVEDLNLGWRSGKSIGKSENLLDFTVGRARYQLGHGFLLYDGAAEGGSRGGYWTNARKAFEFAAIARVKPGHHTFEGFYLDKDDVPEGDSGSRLWGLNYQYAIGEDTTLGATYMKWYAKKEVKPQRDGLNVYNVRAYTAPFPGFKALSFELEYAREDNGDALDSNAWTAQAAYQFGGGWKPKLSYRYAFFKGDDPATPANEAFDPLFLGFYDWGTWWQGEIAGEYFVSNSNLLSHQVRLHVAPSESVGTGLIFYKFLADKAVDLGPQVTDKDIAFEADWYMDWKVNKNFTFSFVAAYANPGKAVEQAFGRTKNFVYGMFYVGYSY
jgi:alginate export protein